MYDACGVYERSDFMGKSGASAPFPLISNRETQVLSLFRCWHWSQQRTRATSLLLLPLSLLSPSFRHTEDQPCCPLCVCACPWRVTRVSRAAVRNNRQQQEGLVKKPWTHTRECTVVGVDGARAPCSPTQSPEPKCAPSPNIILLLLCCPNERVMILISETTPVQ